MYFPKIQYTRPVSTRSLLGEPVDLFGPLFGTLSEGTGNGHADFLPAVDFEDQGSHYMVRADLPGIRPSEVDIRVHEGWLHIEGERVTESKSEELESRFHITERVFGKFQRAVHLPGDIDPDQIEAYGKDGVLQIRIGKKVSAQPRRIEVKVD